MDDASDAGTTNAEYNLPQNVYTPALEKADSSFDHRQRVTASVLYALPFAKASHGLLHRFAGDWHASAIMIVQGALPLRSTCRRALVRTSRTLAWSTGIIWNARIWLAIRTTAPRRRRSGSTRQRSRFRLRTALARPVEMWFLDRGWRTWMSLCRKRRVYASGSSCNSAAMCITFSTTRISIYPAASSELRTLA